MLCADEMLDSNTLLCQSPWYNCELMIPRILIELFDQRESEPVVERVWVADMCPAPTHDNFRPIVSNFKFPPV